MLCHPAPAHGFCCVILQRWEEIGRLPNVAAALASHRVHSCCCHVARARVFSLVTFDEARDERIELYWAEFPEFPAAESEIVAGNGPSLGPGDALASAKGRLPLPPPM
jgi:hypothetical protein